MRAQRKEDLSASIFQAVVNQTISGLACGKPIRGNVAFLGGPLHFLSELKTAFIRTLKLDRMTLSHRKIPIFLLQVGSAMNSKEEVAFLVEDVKDGYRRKLSLNLK